MIPHSESLLSANCTAHVPIVNVAEQIPNATEQNPDAAVILSGFEKPRSYYALKRGLDVALAILLILGALPIFLLAALLIKLDTPGPVLFVQTRAGSSRVKRRRSGEWGVCTFRCYKFRSMYHNADQSVHRAYTEAFIRGQATQSDDEQRLFKLTHDARVTPVGRFLRRTSLDELPQLFNVLKGDMSLVGPRPVPSYELAAYLPHHWARLTAKPGLTGMWQVAGRCRVDFEGMVRMDLDYIAKQSLWLDLKILAQTLPAVLASKGAK